MIALMSISPEVKIWYMLIDSEINEEIFFGIKAIFMLSIIVF